MDWLTMLDSIEFESYSSQIRFLIYFPINILVGLAILQSLALV